MITITIGQASRDLELANEEWIKREFRAAQRDAERPCVRVRVAQGGVDLQLAAGMCGGGGGGGRRPNEKESRVFQLWEQSGITNGSFSPEMLLKFLRALTRML